jgi:hypothetical protein
VPQLLVLEDRIVPSTLTVLNPADSGAGSLRDTIGAAQSGDTIVFDPSLMHQTITLTSGPLALSSNVTIDGLGAKLLALSGNQHSRVFELSGTAQVALTHLTLTGGMSSQGGAILIGGTAALTLDSDILSDNQAVGDSNGNALGGAVFTSAGASLTVHDTLFVNNQTNSKNASFGGALANAGSLSIEGATFSGNAALGSTTSAFLAQPGASQGGAIGNQDGATATITFSTFTGNQALGNGAGDAQGGAICNEDVRLLPFNGRGVTTNVSQCTFADNTAKGGNDAIDGGYGGAIEDKPGTTLAVLNCSFTGNQADSGGGPLAQGGAIDDSVAVTATISDSQFMSNSALGSGVGATGFGGAVLNLQTTTIANCLFTGNGAVGGPMADGVNAYGQALGGAIFTGLGLQTGASMVVLNLSNSIVAGNEAIGGSEGSTLAYPRTDAALGGGILNYAGGTLNIAGCTVTGNQALGGGTTLGSGGVALGGGIENLQATLNLMNSTVSTNLSQGAAGASGAAGGQASGGGIGNDLGAIGIITNCTVSLNESLGGAVGAGANGGTAVGAGIANAVYALFGRADASS